MLYSPGVAYPQASIYSATDQFPDWRKLFWSMNSIHYQVIIFSLRQNRNNTSINDIVQLLHVMVSFLWHGARVRELE